MPSDSSPRRSLEAGRFLSTAALDSLSPSTPGWVRLEGFQVSTTFFFPAGGTYITRGAPIDEALLRPPAGSVRVTAIAGIPIPIYPTGSFELPDATIKQQQSRECGHSGHRHSAGNSSHSAGVSPDT